MTIITARIRRMTEGNIFTLSTIAGRGGTLSQVGIEGVPPIQDPPLYRAA